MKLIIDYREKHSITLFKDICEDVVCRQLPIGDYLLISNSEAVIIERKTVNDFWSSVKSNRLWDQLLRMMKVEKVLGYPVRRRMLLIQGNFVEYFMPFTLEDKQLDLVHWSQLMGAFLEVIYVYNTPIIHAEDETSFKAFMRILIKREVSGKNDKLPSARWYKKPVKSDLPIKDRKKYILSSLPYVGERLAENLLLHFNTISKIACASQEELEKVPKIGKKKAVLIYQMFH